MDQREAGQENCNVFSEIFWNDCAMKGLCFSLQAALGCAMISVYEGSLHDAAGSGMVFDHSHVR